MILPLISIIIPTYNRASLLGSTLNSIVNQSYTNWECIIIDDGSDDNTDEIVSLFSNKNPSIKYFKRPDNLVKGPNSCRNYGFFKSNGNIINWFDSDDLYLPNAFQLVVNKYINKLDLVVVKLEIIDLLTKKKIKENIILSNSIIEDYFTGKIAYYVCGPFWKRNFLEKQKILFDENIRNLDDWDFNIRMLLQNPTIFYINQPLIQYQYHQNSLSQEIKKFNFVEMQSEINAREKILKLIKINILLNSLEINKFYISRCKYFLKEALLRKNSKKYYLLKKTLNLQVRNKQFVDAFKILFGFVVFSIFNKGYKLIKF